MCGRILQLHWRCNILNTNIETALGGFNKEKQNNELNIHYFDKCVVTYMSKFMEY
jgi:hypothetical protein